MVEHKKEVKIIIATHKKYKMPTDNMYLPLHVGAEGKKDKDGIELNLGYIKDNTGENISELNSSFCELTGLYWAWKNLNSDYIGLAHYRRHFSLSKKSSDKFDNILSYEELSQLLDQYKVFIPKKRNYYIETLYSHYKHTHYSIHLDVTRDIISEKYPEYLKTYDKVLKQTYGYMFNMMILEKNLLNEYCIWLFDILDELKNRIDMPELSSFQGRFYGRVSEIIFNVWLQQQINDNKLKKSDIKEIPCIHMEDINWSKKGTAFLKAKFLNKKYEGSF
ncbi:MAG: DUF4422 domain-containing protein [Clostridium perfringens]|uniref:DUF4422 domain-containing protein n=1 Tax=Clostridium perfringens TaxID=1502 RepID=UPI002912C657|nr:DUF4422 domain-containing protein [Clostridium perfringens]MDK0622146.1 DUF4422 domain-containing protein [Clostridium perfringens]MDU5776157.1 DUF4422 domain-containing protein [Clostridium perfringens]